MLTLTLVTLILATTAAAGKPRLHRFPHWWYLQSVCIHRHESVNWRANTGNGYYGGLQFSLSTWRAQGGTGYPHQHSAREQKYRAVILIQKAGYGPWPVCGRV